MVDQVVDGSQDDGDQPGHNPRPELKSNYWPETFAVHLPTRDGQQIPIGAAYQGVIGGSHVYALMTKAVPSDPVEPITLDGQDCDGNPVPLTADVGQIAYAVQHPDHVFKVQLCDNSKDIQRSILCDPATNHKVAVITDFTVPSSPVTTYWDIIAGESWSGDPLTLEECPDSDVESDSMDMCDDGTTFLRWIVKSNGQPTGEKFDTTLSGQPYTVSDEGSVTVGKCVIGCPPVNYLGVATTW